MSVRRSHGKQQRSRRKNNRYIRVSKGYVDNDDPIHMERTPHGITISLTPHAKHMEDYEINDLIIDELYGDSMYLEDLIEFRDPITQRQVWYMDNEIYELRNYNNVVIEFLRDRELQLDIITNETEKQRLLKQYETEFN